VVDTSELPGAELVERGLRDLADGVESTAALVVAIGAPRLRELGWDVTHAWSNPEHLLYKRLAAEFGSDEAHSRYNALVRLLVSFERAVECAS
jgi:hypothetical protein